MRRGRRRSRSGRIADRARVCGHERRRLLRAGTRLRGLWRAFLWSCLVGEVWAEEPLLPTALLCRTASVLPAPPLRRRCCSRHALTVYLRRFVVAGGHLRVVSSVIARLLLVVGLIVLVARPVVFVAGHVGVVRHHNIAILIDSKSGSIQRANRRGRTGVRGLSAFGVGACGQDRDRLAPTRRGFLERDVCEDDFPQRRLALPDGRDDDGPFRGQLWSPGLRFLGRFRIDTVED